MQDLIPDILKEIITRDKGNSVMFGKGYIPVEIKEESFFEIKKVTGVERKTKDDEERKKGEGEEGKKGEEDKVGREKNRKLAFVDGGNQEIIGGANFSLQLLRIYYCVYENNKRVRKGSRELFVLVRVSNTEGKMVYTVSSFESGASKNLDKFGDFALYENNHKVSPGKISCDVRKLIEIKILNEIIESFDPDDIIVRDGDLCAQNEYEKEKFDCVYKFAEEKGIVVCGISKTNELITNTGESAVVMVKEKEETLQKNKHGKIWYCSPIVLSNTNMHKAKIMFVKLHKLSDYIFRFDIHTNCKFEGTEINDVLYALSKNSCDPTFLGYPYGLINADKFARVTNSEKEYYKMQIFMKGENKIKNYLRGIDAHSILDTIG